jgi:hypothetical protein
MAADEYQIGSMGDHNKHVLVFNQPSNVSARQACEGAQDEEFELINYNQITGFDKTSSCRSDTPQLNVPTSHQPISKISLPLVCSDQMALNKYQND